MFQTPSTTTTQPAPARPKWQLAGRQVTQDMFYAVQNANRAGKRCLLVTAGSSEISGPRSDEDCPNCGGFGHLALEVLMVGPLKDMPATQQGTADSAPAVHLRPAFHNKAWWLVARDLFNCPVCNGRKDIIL